MKVIFTWIEARNWVNTDENCTDGPQLHCWKGSSTGVLIQQMDKISCACESSKVGKRKYLESSDVFDTGGIHPINEIFHWHNAIRRELRAISMEARKIQLSGDFTNLSSFNERLHFIAEVCIFHRYHFPFYTVFFFLGFRVSLWIGDLLTSLLII